MKLYLIRHAQSANNAAATNSGDETERVPDPEITQTGHQQARLLAQHLALPMGETQQHPLVEGVSSSFGITHLYCSLMTRSVLTAQYIAQAIAVPVIALPDIFERGGIFEEGRDGSKTGLPGPGEDYFRERFPELRLAKPLGEGGWYNRPYETEALFLRRMTEVARPVTSTMRITWPWLCTGTSLISLSTK